MLVIVIEGFMVVGAMDHEPYFVANSHTRSAPTSTFEARRHVMIDMDDIELVICTDHADFQRIPLINYA